VNFGSTGASTNMKIGFIAEEDNDVDVLIEITAKIIPKNSFSSKKFVGRGCGKLRQKCGAWAKNLKLGGCDVLVIAHDLDRCIESNIRECLDSQIRNLAISSKIVLIPTEELEAWLLCDPFALKECFGMKQLPKVPTHPEKVESPKEHLRDIVWKFSQKRYLNTVHNKKIAKLISLSKLDICMSFRAYPLFLRSIDNR
jgi:hypothetical protein